MPGLRQPLHAPTTMTPERGMPITISRQPRNHKLSVQESDLNGHTLQRERTNGSQVLGTRGVRVQQDVPDAINLQERQACDAQTCSQRSTWIMRKQQESNEKNAATFPTLHARLMCGKNAAYRHRFKI